MAREWLQTQHPLYTERYVEWAQNERRYRGGMHVLSELRRFDWETAPLTLSIDSNTALADREQAYQKAAELALLDPSMKLAGTPGEHYTSRQAQALYLNFGESFLAMLGGHLFKKRPSPDDGGLNFGSLGIVRRDRAGDAPTSAELVYYNIDGVGNDGSQWDAWWSDVTRWAGVTGHRWLFVEATTQPGVTQRDVQQGKRPYLVHHSPLEVLNWDYVNGQLAWALIQLPPRAAVIKDGALTRETTGPVRLYVQKGFTGLDEASDGGLIFSAGGWWTFDGDGDPITGEGTTGTWDKTGGEIPLWPHFYQRDKDYFSRPGMTEVGSAAVAYMNLDSAANYDVWDSASSLLFLLGVDPDSFKVAMDKFSAGAKFIPVPMTQPALGSTGGSVVPTVYDGSMGAVTADVFAKRMLAIREAVREITGMEVSGAPDSSGLSKIAGFGDSKSPRLALLASEVETSQNIALLFLERRFGYTREMASVRWTRDFELAPVIDSIERLVALQKDSGVESPTLTARALTTAAKNAGLVTDDQDEQVIADEFAASARVAATSRKQAAGLAGEFGRKGIDIQAPNASQMPALAEIMRAVAAGEMTQDEGMTAMQDVLTPTPNAADTNALPPPSASGN